MAPLSTQQLAEFLAAVSSAADGQHATSIAIERAARALEAEVAVVIRRGEVAGAIGFPAGQLPIAELAAVAGGARSVLDVPGAGRCPTVVAPLRSTPGCLLLARSGDDGFSVEEVSLVRGMARVLELTVQLLETFEAERRQADENARLLADLAATDARTQEAMYQAHHDPLTKLASRALFMERLAEAGRPAVLFVDLDRFKLVNDSLGHAAGDLLLIEVADRLRNCLGVGATAARLGGDEFAILLPFFAYEGEAADVAGRILTALRAPFTLHGKEVFVDASIGIAFGPADPEELVRNADLAMYEAKRQGKGRYARFEPCMQAALQRKLELEAELRRAVDRAEFVLHYQPVVRLADGQVTGVEALLRWQHPERGLVQPADFIGLADETGLIAAIDRWVLSTACAQVSAWNARRADQPPLSLSVNLCTRQIIHQTDLAARIAGVLAASDLRPEHLVLELNGSLLQHDAAATTARLRQLRAVGIRLAMADFGAGSASLADLRRFPFDVMKIDRSFVADIAHVPEATALTRALVQLGNSLRLATVAEGIEAANQLAELRDAGCQLGQGYYFSKPLDPDELDAVL